MAEKVTASEIRDAQEGLAYAKERRDQAFTAAIDQGRSYEWVAMIAELHKTSVYQIVRRVRAALITRD